MKNKNTIISALLGAAFSVGSLNAAFQTDSVTGVGVGTQTFNFLGWGSTPEAANPLNVLTGITIEFSANSNGDGGVAVDNEGGTSASISGTGFLSATTQNLFTSIVPLNQTSIALVQNSTIPSTTLDADIDGTFDDGPGPNPSTEFPDYTGSDSATFTLTALSDSGSINIDSSAFGVYQNAFAIDVSFGQGTDLSLGGTVFQQFSPSTFDGSATVTYTFNVIPEPSTALGLGLAGGLFFLRRRRS